MFKNAVNIEVTVFSRGVPINQFQVVMYLKVVINISFHVVLTFVFKLLQVGTRCLCVAICLQVVTRCIYELLQCTSSSCINTFGNDVARHSAPQNPARK